MSRGIFASKRWWMLAIFPVVSLLGALLWFVNAARPNVFELSDGSTVEFLQVTYGTNHVVQLQPWHLRLRSRVAARFPKLIRPRLNFFNVSPLTSSNDSVAVWFRRTKLPGSTLEPLKVFALDSAKTACHEPTMTTQSYQSLTQEVAGYLFTAFPRREKEFLVACTVRDPGSSSLRTFAEFPIPLSHRNASNSWSAMKFPVTKRDGDLSFSLTRLQAGIDFSRRDKSATNVFDAAVLAGFRVSQGDQTLTNWQPGKIWMSDGSGNVAESSLYSNREKNGEQLLWFQRGLWSTEPAWKLRTEFTRTSGFESNEVWRVSIPALPLIPERDFYKWKQSNCLAKTTLNGDVLKIVGLQEQSPYSNGKGSTATPLPFTVEMEASPPREDFRLTLLEVSDETGRKLERSGSGWSAGYANYRIDDLGRAKTLNLVVAYHQKRYVEFIAKPEPFVEDKSDAKSR